ncbi:MAG: class I SAM-dependent methyltransferase [Desertifilum sp. SIO1I2]|nr:class I SAM-dependent methyltransferase [Desertifilum sp. SIO1I2]
MAKWGSFASVHSIPNSCQLISTSISAENYPAIRAFIQDQAVQAATFNSNIHPDDEMFSFLLDFYQGNTEKALLAYFKSGQEVMDRVRQIIEWKFGNFEKLESFLDFACGYGRFTRFLVQELSPKRICVSDIYKSAVDFQKQQFGVQGIYSTTNPAKWKCDRTFDCILVASLFSHLPESTFIAWLAKLYHQLSPQGILLFSVHDSAILPTGQQMPESGICFVEDSESKSLSTQEYGSTWVTETFVVRAIQQATGESLPYYRIKKGLWQQDLYILAKNPNIQFSNLQVKSMPRGYLGKCFINDKYRLQLQGWAVDLSPNDFIKAVQIWINGQLKQECLPITERPDVAELLGVERVLKAGWVCSCPLDLAIPLNQTILLVKIISTSGIERIIHISILESALTKPLPNRFEIPEALPGKITLDNRIKAGWRVIKEQLSIQEKKGWIKGNLDEIETLTSSYFVLKGWAVDTSLNSQIADVQIWLNDQLIQRCKPFITRVDVAQFLGDERLVNCGWTCAIEWKGCDRSDRLIVKAISSNQTERILYQDFLQAALKLNHVN